MSLRKHSICGGQQILIYALDAKTGKKIWSYKTAGPVWSTPFIDHGVLYIGSVNVTKVVIDGLNLEDWDIGGYVYALDIKSGKQL